MERYVNSIIVTVMFLANVIFLAGKWLGDSGTSAEEQEERCSRLERVIADLNDRFEKSTTDLRARTHVLAGQLTALPTELNRYFMPREVSEMIVKESLEDRQRIRDSIEALWKELRTSRSRPRNQN